MKARRKSDGEIISVEAIVYNAKNGERYSPSELDFNVNYEDTVIQGWVARDKSGDLYVYHTKPLRNVVADRWRGERSDIDLYNNLLFPDLTWDDEPQEVEIIIKRKKNG